MGPNRVTSRPRGMSQGADADADALSDSGESWTCQARPGRSTQLTMSRDLSEGACASKDMDACESSRWRRRGKVLEHTGDLQAVLSDVVGGNMYVLAEPVDSWSACDEREPGDGSLPPPHGAPPSDSEGEMHRFPVAGGGFDELLVRLRSEFEVLEAENAELRSAVGVAAVHRGRPARPLSRHRDFEKMREVSSARTASKTCSPALPARRVISPVSSSVSLDSLEDKKAASPATRRAAGRSTCRGSLRRDGRSITERVLKLQRWYKRLDSNDSGILPLQRLFNILRHARPHETPSMGYLERLLEHLPKSLTDDDVEEELAEALIYVDEVVLRRSTFSGTSDKESRSNDAMTFTGFSYLMLTHFSEVDMSIELRQMAYCLKDALIKHSTDVLVAHFAHLALPDVSGLQDQKASQRFLQCLDVASGFVIILNGMTIGLSVDVAWPGFTFIELFFSIFFFFEIVSKMAIHNPKVFYFGPDRVWNMLDTCIVALATMDTAVLLAEQVAPTNSSGAATNQLNSVAFIRLARLARLARLMRLLRVLRLRVFRELMLMVKGVMAGLKTLFWAIFLLLFIIYVVALLLRQTVGLDQITVGDRYGTVLFSDMVWCIFMIFRVCMSDGALPDGTPLVGHLYEIYGVTFVIPYILTLLFIVFGIFNLITAVFVENVMESAKQKRQLTLVPERVRVAKKLRELVFLFSGRVVEEESACTQFWRRVTKAFNTSGEVPTDDIVARIVSSEDTSLDMDGQITREMFVEAMKNPKVERLLDDLEVHMADRSDLFDVLDADNSGAIDISELIAGLMKLRNGGADKSDAVASVLGIRAVLIHLRNLEERFDEVLPAKPTRSSRQQWSPPSRKRSRF